MGGQIVDFRIAVGAGNALHDGRRTPSRLVVTQCLAQVGLRSAGYGRNFPPALAIQTMTSGTGRRQVDVPCCLCVGTIT